MNSKITFSQNQKLNFGLIFKDLKINSLQFFSNKIILLLLITTFSSTQLFSQDVFNNKGKESLRNDNGVNAKTVATKSVEDFSDLSLFNRSNVCSPETSLVITEGSSWGISRSSLNNSGIPSFCLSINDDAPQEDDVFNTTLTPSSDISFNNPNLSASTIRDRVQRTMSVIRHPNFAPSSQPSSLTSNFYKAIAVVVWSWTDNLTVNNNNNNYTWTGSNGNTYSANNLKSWVLNGTLQATDVHWLLPVNSNRQPEILLNENSSSDCCPTPPSVTFSTQAATSGNNGKIILNSNSNGQFYGVSSVNAGSYNGPTTIATATAISNSLPSTIFNNAPSSGGTYIVRVFTNIDECFTDYTITVPVSNSNCTYTYAEVESENGVDNEDDAEGAPDGSFAEIYSNSDQLILDLGQVFPAGTEYEITWRKRSGENGTAIIDLSESISPSSGFTNHPTSPQTTSTNSSVTTTVVSNSNFRYVAFDKGNSSTTDYKIDAVGVITCITCETADNTTSTATIFEGQTKTLTGTPAGGTFSIVQGSGSINNNIYSTGSINANETVIIRYTVPASGSCPATTSDVTFTVTNCNEADNTTSTASITENETKTLTATPAGGTWSIVSGGGTINGNTYTPDDINTNTTVKIRYTIASNGSCAASSDDVTFTVTPVCVVADNTTSTSLISELETKTLTATPAGGTWSIVSGGGTINGNTYTPDNIVSDVNVKIRYTIAADGSCAASTDDVTFKVEAIPTASATKTDVTCFGLDDGTITITFSDNTGRTHIQFSLDGGNTYQPKVTDDSGSVTYSNLAPGTYDVWARWGDTDYPTDLGTDLVISEPAQVVANNTTSTATINEGQTKTLTGTPNGGTWSIISGGGTINGNIYTPSDINTNTTVTIRYTVAGINGCSGATDDVTFTVTPVCAVADNTTSTATITENDTKTLTGSPAGGSFTIVSGGGTINNGVYTPADVNTDTTIVIRYTIAADGSCSASSDDVTFTVTPVCAVADNTTSTATITENDTKTLTGSPAGGIFTIVSGGGNINGNTYTPADVNTNTTVLIRYTIPADGSCSASSDDVTFTVTPVCAVADNTTSTATITENDTKTLTGSPSGGTFIIVSGGGTINGNTYTPADVNTDTTVVIRYTIAADGSCSASSDDVTFTVTPVCAVADNTTSTATISENGTKTLTGSPAGGTFTIVSGGGTINNGVYTPADVNTNTTVVIRYTIPADGSCSASSDDVTFTVTPVCDVADNTTSTATISENDTKTLTGSPAGGTFTIVSGGGIINNGVYTPADINTNTTVVIRYTIPADGSCSASSDDVTFTVTPDCAVADNTTSTATITENDTKTLTGSPAGGIFTIVSGGGNINGNTYTPADVNTNTTVLIRYTIPADGSCSASSDDVTFTVTPVCAVADNTTSTATITENDTKILTGSPSGGTFTIVSGGGTINGNTYTPADVNTDTTVVIRYTIPADGSCSASSDDVTFTVTSVGPKVTQDFESGDRGIDIANCWGFGGFTVNSNNKINGDFSARSGAINSTKGSFYLKSPWIELASGNVSFDIKLNNDDNQDYYVEISFIPFDPTNYKGEGTKVGTYTHTLQTPLSSVETVTYAVPANIANDGNPYRVYLTVYNQNGNRNRRAIIDDWCIPGVVVSDKNSNCFPPNLVGSIGDTVWFDANENGAKDNGESGLEGATVSLDPGTPNDPSDDKTTTTDANGNYIFNNLFAGNYTVSVDTSTVTGGLPNGVTVGQLSQTFDADGTGTTNTSSTNLNAGQDIDNQDFGYKACTVANNTTDNATITENDTKTLTGSPAGGTFTIVSGGGTINNGVYTPADVNTDTTVVIRYTIPADGSCSASSDDVTFTVTPVCTVADNTTDNASITENDTKTLMGSPADGTFTIVSGGGTINNGVYTPADVNTDTTVVIRYTIAADGSCSASSDDVTFTVTPVCDVADNTTSTATITENDTKTLTGSPAGGTFTVISGGGTINNNIYTPADVNTDTTVVIRYTIAADGSCSASSDDVTFTVEEAGNCFLCNPTSPSEGFNVFTLNGLTLTTNETEGGVATGGDLTINGNYQIATNVSSSFIVNNSPIGLLVDGKVIYQSGNSLQINQNNYVKIGEANGSVAWYSDPNNAPTPIRVTPDANYNASPFIQLQANAATFNASANNNPVFENNLIDFAAAFQSLVTNSNALSQKTHNAQLTNPNGQSISNTNLPNQVKINLQNGVNYLNVTGADLNNVDVFTYNNKPNASRILIVNVDAPGSFNWDVWNQAGVGQQDAPYILYNFYNTTTLNIVGNSTIVGSVLAPNADINKTVNQSNIEGQVIGKSFVHAGGEIHSANFDAQIEFCTTQNGETPTASFSFSGDNCFDNNSFTFTNSSSTTNPQPNHPISYAWDFGDGTTSTDMNPTKTYAAAGTYTVTLTATNTFGSDVTTQQVTVLDPIDHPVISKAVLSSGGGNVEYEFTLDNDTTFDSWSWEIPGQGSGLFTDQKSITVNYNAAGVYEVTVTGVKGGCSKAQTISITISSGETTGGNNGGVESESLGDAISKIYVGRKKNSVPTVFVKDNSNLYNKSELQSKQPYQGKGQTMLDMFPTELVAGNVANVTSPTDILDYTIADEVLSVDFSLDGKTKGVVLGVKTSDKVYNHTKASCDRLRGAEILNVVPVSVGGYNFLMQAIKQRNGVVEHAISFAVAKNNNDANYSIQGNWYVNDYIKFNDMYNFQVWTTNPEDTKKLVIDILNNLKSFIPVNQVEKQKIPRTYAAKISRDKDELVVKLRSTEKGMQTEISMDEIYSETANNVKHRYNPLYTQLEQELRIDIADGYEYDALVKVANRVEDAFYHADGNWGLDFDSRYTSIKEYFVSNNFDREYKDDEYAINRNVKIKATSEYDYLTVYKSLLPGTISADYSEYKYLAFTAKGSGVMELGLIKSSIQDWKQQYRIMVDLSEEEQTYYVPFDAFTSVGTQAPITADDLTTLTFTFLPVEANTTELDLEISDVKFTKVAVEELVVNKVEKFENEFVAYPNPSQGNVNLLLFSKVDTEAEVSLTDITGKVIFKGKANLTTGKNELDFNFNSLRTGMYLLKVASKEANYGTSKILFR